MWFSTQAGRKVAIFDEMDSYSPTLSFPTLGFLLDFLHACYVSTYQFTLFPSILVSKNFENCSLHFYQGY